MAGGVVLKLAHLLDLPLGRLRNFATQNKLAADGARGARGI
jgi:hypothetical protein